MEFLLKDRLSKSVQEYCSTNNLDINDYLNDLIEKSHFSNVYGEQPSFIKPRPEQQQVLKTENNSVDFKKEPEISSVKSVVETPVKKNDAIQVVEITGKPKIRVLK